MKKTLSIFMFLLLVNSCFGQGLQTQRFLDDLKYLQAELPARHFNLFAKITAEEFGIRLEKIKSRLDHLDPNGFTNELYKLLKAIGDEHTKIEAAYEQTFPLTFDTFREGTFVVRTDRENDHLLYAKLRKIDGRSLSKVTSMLKKVLNDENESYFKVYSNYYLSNPSFLKGLAVLNSSYHGLYSFKTLSEGLLDVELYPKTRMEFIKGNEINNKIKLLRYSRPENYWYSYDPNSRTIYFNYQRCAADQKIPFQSFCDSLFSTIENTRPEKIVLDLRANSGGNSAVLQPFLNRIASSYLNNKGSFFVFIGKSTFSSALMNAIELKRRFNTILVGEQTSGNINHFGETRRLTLPNTKINIVSNIITHVAVLNASFVHVRWITFQSN
ncbi:MAG: hypothetical protein EOO20_15665 [Chryseobacterium sp.]|nr:MAG: hypothetical protein EOO20_15665 [Chryseobacterium sp.]